MSEIFTGFNLYLGVVLGKVAVLAVIFLIFMFIYIVFGKDDKNAKR